MVEELEISDPVVVRALSAGRGVHYLAPYFAGPRAVAEAAEYLEEPIARVHYWTRRWCELGLLEVVEERARAGRPIRLYRTVAQRFVVRPEHLPEGHFDRMVDRYHRHLGEALRRAVLTENPMSLLVHQMAGQVGVSVSNTPTPELPERRSRRDSIHSSVGLHLDDAEARELAEELGAVLRRWSERCGDRRPGAGRSTYLALVAMTPDERD